MNRYRIRNKIIGFAAAGMMALGLIFGFGMSGLEARADNGLKTATPSNAPVVKYNLWIGGTQVTDANCADILGDGKKAVSYNAASHTLSLNGATLKGVKTGSGDNTAFSAVISREKELKIQLTGTNQIVSDGTASKLPGIGIDTGNAPISISGTGNLSMNIAGTSTVGILSASQAVFGGSSQVHITCASGKVSAGVSAPNIIMKDKAILEALGASAALDGIVQTSDFQKDSAYVNTAASKSKDLWDGKIALGKDPATGKAGGYRYVCLPVTDVFYYISDGKDLRWRKSIGASATFTFERSRENSKALSHFKSVKVDGKTVPASGYTASAGSVTIKMKPSYLETLALGTHKLIAVFDDGQSEEVSFMVTKFSESRGSSSGSSSRAVTGAITSPATKDVNGNTPYTAPYVASSGSTSGTSSSVTPSPQNTPGPMAQTSPGQTSSEHYTASNGPVQNTVPNSGQQKLNGSAQSVYINPNVPTQHLPNSNTGNSGSSVTNADNKSVQSNKNDKNSKSSSNNTKSSNHTVSKDTGSNQQSKSQDKLILAEKETKQTADKESQAVVQTAAADTVQKESASSEAAVSLAEFDDSGREGKLQGEKSDAEAAGTVNAVKPAGKALGRLGFAVAAILALGAAAGAIVIAFRKNGY